MIGRLARTRLASASIGVELDADIRRQIDLVDDEQIAPQQSRSLLARNVVAARDVDHEDPPIDQIERKGRCEIVAAGLEQDQFDAGKPAPRARRRRRYSTSDPRGSRYAGTRRLRRRRPAHGSIRPERRNRSASSLVTRSLVTTARSTPRRCSSGISASISAVLPEPTGPPMPTRAAGDTTADPGLFSSIAPHRSPQHVAARERHFARRLAGRKYTVDEHIEGLGIDSDLWTGIVPQHVALRKLARAADRKHLLGKAKLSLQIARDRQRMHEASRQGRGQPCRTRPIAAASGSARRSSARLRCRPSRPRR